MGNCINCCTTLVENSVAVGSYVLADNILCNNTSGVNLIAADGDLITCHRSIQKRYNLSLRDNQ